MMAFDNTDLASSQRCGNTPVPRVGILELPNP